MRPLTARQQQIHDFIREYRERSGGSYGPTVREIAAHLEIKSAHGAWDHLRLMRKKGAVTWDEGKVRSLRAVVDGAAVEPPRPVQVIPVFSRVTLGGGLAEENHVRDVRVVGGPIAAAHFGLVVSGTSLLPEYQPGDELFFRMGSPVTGGGDLALVLLGDAAVVRRVFIRGDHVQLRPVNGAVAPTIVRRGDWRPTTVVGVAVGMFRRYEPASAQPQETPLAVASLTL